MRARLRAASTSASAASSLQEARLPLRGSCEKQANGALQACWTFAPPSVSPPPGEQRTAGKAYFSRPGVPNVVTSAALADKNEERTWQLPSFIMSDFPTSLGDFQRRYPNEAACAASLFAARWPAGFRCRPAPREGMAAWQKALPLRVRRLGKQTSVTAGTIMHGSKLPLTAWFWAAFSWPPIPTAFRHCNSQRTRPRLLQVGVAPGRQTSPGHGRAGPLAAGRPRRGRRDGNPLAHQG